jgi:hypothetical protein
MSPLLSSFFYKLSREKRYASLWNAQRPLWLAICAGALECVRLLRLKRPSIRGGLFLPHT